MVQRRLQVFVSSTYIDLKLERQAAVEAILSAGHIPAGMELFAAEDRSQWDTIKRWIDDSDALILLLGGRYGSIEKDSGLSYTHLEYEYARERGKPVYGIVLRESYIDQKVADLGKSAVERDEGSKYSAFRDVVLGHMCKEVTNIDQVQLGVFQALTACLNDMPDDAGWVRAKDVSDPKALVEQIASLQAQLEKARKSPNDQNRSQTENGKLEETLVLMERYTTNMPTPLATRLGKSVANIKEVLTSVTPDILAAGSFRLVDSNTTTTSDENAKKVIGLCVAVGVCYPDVWDMKITPFGVDVLKHSLIQGNGDFTGK